MAEDLGVGIVHLQRLQQGVQGGLLLTGAGVGRTALRRQSAFIAHAYRVLVLCKQSVPLGRAVVAGVCPDKILVPRLVHVAVAGDVIVVAGEPEAGIVAGDEVLDREPAVAARGAAVDDDEIDCTHD